MILEFGARNFFSFKEGMEISFRLSKSCPAEISQNKEYTRVLCVKGANGSGKTNVLKALSFISFFCSDSFNRKPDTSIPVESFFHNKEPTSFYIEFKTEETLYRYELELTQEKVVRETLYRTEKRENKIIERVGNTLTKCIKEFADLKIIKLRSNASIISTANQYELEKITPIYQFFHTINTNVLHYGLGNLPDLNTLTRFYKKHPDYLEFVEKIIIQFDEDIQGIEIVKHEDDQGEEQYRPVFLYKMDNEEKSLPFRNQSSGTKSLYLQLARYKAVIDYGAVLILDEFDINLHPLILPLLLELFIDSSINHSGAQLIFTTHHSEVLDFLGRYRTYLVNKEENESYAYRLDEIPGDILRNDRPIMPVYNSGKIGGVPKI